MRGIEKFKTLLGFEKPEAKAEVESEEPRTEVLLPETLVFQRRHLDIAEFNPNWELKEIRQFVRDLPPEVQSSQRRTLVRDFKEKLRIMRENTAQISIDAEKVLRENPDIPSEELKEKLRGLVEKKSADLPRDVVLKLDRGMGKYVEIRDDIRSIIEYYKQLSDKYRSRKEWQAELFKDLFGKYPAGRIEIETVFGGLYFRVHNIEDYVLAYISGEEQSRPSLDRNARISSGVKLGKQFPKLPQLSNRVILENSTASDKLSRGTEMHEEEHSIHLNLYPKELFDYPTKMVIFESENSVLNYEVFKNRISKFARLIVRNWEGEAKTEVLAYLKTEDWRGSMATIRFLLTNENGLYNYFRDDNVETLFKNEVTGRIKLQNLRIEKDGLTLGETELEQACSDVITDAWNKDYKNTLGLALNAVETLLQKYGNNPEDRLKVIRLLAQEPLDKWPRLVRILS